MSAGDPLLIQQTGAVIELVLNRPDKANALDARLVEALLAAISHAASSDAKLLMLRGEGRHSARDSTFPIWTTSRTATSCIVSFASSNFCKRCIMRP
jgi:hypothetical protein